MLILNADDVRRLASMPKLVASLREAFQSESIVPPRQVTKMPGGAGERLLLVMPAFETSGSGVVKLATVVPDNQAGKLPTIQGVVILFSTQGTPLALLDGSMVTRLRTGAASALAADYLARTDSDHLLIVGTGALAPMMALAHCSVRPIERVSVWGRDAGKASATATAIRSLLDRKVEIGVTDDLASACATASIVSCSTSSTAPIIQGKWLEPGTLVDLVGSFSPAKRESDDDVVKRSRIFVDTFEDALSEAGDIIDPMRRRIIERDKIEGELADLVTRRVRGRANAEEIIVFKSVGTAIEDLAAAKMIFAAATRGERRV